MSIAVELHCLDGIHITQRQQLGKFCTIDLASDEYGFNHVTLFLWRIKDIETLVSALQKLGNDFAAAASVSNADIDAKMATEFGVNYIGDLQDDEGYPIIRFYEDTFVSKRILVEIGPTSDDVTVFTFHKNLEVKRGR